jgi:hypothetical protein
MIKRVIGLAMFVPGILAAQAGSGAASGTATAKPPQASMQAQANANASVSLDPPKSFSADGRARLAAMYEECKKNGLPPEAVARRVAEGEAKGASESAILNAAAKVQARLEASHQALVRAGRHPSPGETEQGANAIERGFTSVQLEALAKHAPADRSLTVAFDVLTQLSAKGLPVNEALTQVQTKLEARAPDTAIQGLLGGSVGVGRRGGQ